MTSHTYSGRLAWICLATGLAFSVAYSGETARVRFFLVEEAPQGLYYEDATGSRQAFSFAPYETGYPLEITVKAGSVVLYRKEANANRPTFRPAIRIKIPEAPETVLAVLHKKPDGTWDSIVCDESLDAFPVSSVRIINLLPVQIKSLIGKEILELDPYDSKVIKVKSSTTRPVVNVLTVHEKGDGGWKQFYHSPTVLLPEARLTGIALVTRGLLDATFGFKDDSATEAKPIAQENHAHEVRLHTWSERMPRRKAARPDSQTGSP